MSAHTDPLSKLFRQLKEFFISVLSIRAGTDRAATIAGIHKDIGFRGPTAWILMFSIFIASIGLNVNSVAVIVGAMLISPLMGPILGIGLSLAQHDKDILFKSLKNYLIAILLSLMTSTLYFMLTPLDIEHSELLNRTRPTILDVLVALFGGLAGIIAGSRREKSNVVPGVAIATALMPPLCTAGYGIANLNSAYFLGAFYLFFINSVFIALSTYLVVIYLRFPKVEFLDKRTSRNYKIGLYSFLVITVLPSAWIFWSLIQESRYTVAAEKFVAEVCQFDGSELISQKVSFHDTLSVIDLYYIGERINQDKVLYLENKLNDYQISGNEKFPSSKKTKIVIHQDKDENEMIEQKFKTMNKELRLSVLEDIYTKNEELIKDKDLKINLLEDELLKLKTLGIIPMNQLFSEINFHYPEIQKFSFANVIEVNSSDSLTTDTIPSLLIQFRKNVNKRQRQKEMEKINEWLKIRFDKNDFQVIEY